MLRFILPALFALTTAAQADLSACKALMAKAPNAIGPLKFARDHDYETEYPGAGYAAVYEQGSTRLSVFFYDGKMNRISEKMLRQTFQKARKDIVRVAEKSDINITDMTEFAPDPALHTISLLLQARSSVDRSEFLAMGLRNDCMVKLRYTSKNRLSTERKRFTALISQLEATF